MERVLRCLVAGPLGGNVTGERVPALGQLALGVDLALARGGRKAAVGERQPVPRQGERRPAVATQPLEGNAFEKRMVAIERQLHQLFIRNVEPGLFEAQPARQPAEELGVR